MQFQPLRAVVAACAFLLASGATAQNLPGPSPADLVATPAIDTPLLSPEGSRVVARALVDGRARLALFDAANLDAKPVPIALPEAERLEWYRWLGEDRLLVSLLHQGGSPTSRLSIFDLSSGTLSQIGKARPARDEDQVLHVARDGSFVLIAETPPGSETPGVSRIDLITGSEQIVVAPQPHVWDWIVDSAGVVRAGMAEQGNRTWILYRRGSQEGFSRSARGAGDASTGIADIVPVAGSDEGYALAPGRSGRVGLYRYDFRRSRLGERIYEHPTLDLDGFEAAPDGRLLGVGFGTGRGEMHWFDSRLAQRQAVVDAALPGRVNRVLAGAKGDGRLLVLSRSAGDPGAFYLVRDGRAALLAEINPALHGKASADMRSVRYVARDGLAIGGFLTLPAGREAKGLPLVVMPHGGPFARDEWGYDPWVQYLAGKGYAVLQPNFRGSTGQGEEFLARGDGAWGRGMQDDIDDGVGWLAGQGTIDASRVCIMGASFGGYAAMWATARGGRTYRCAISFAGISDVRAQLDYDHQTFTDRDYRAWKRRIQGNARSLDALSPIERVGALATPILIAHGTADDTVPPEQSVKLHQALQRLGRPHDYVAYQGEGHNLSDPANLADFLMRVGRFLDANNPS